MQKQEAFIGIGTNLGDKPTNLRNALQLIESELGQIIGVSSVYSTEPWGVTNQEEFLNQVVRIYTDLEPAYLLKRIHELEDALGRVRTEKWGPRVIDIDLLYYGKYVIDRDDLIIPHPELTERNFVLAPLAEIAPDFVHPIFKLTNKELLDFCSDTSKVVKC